MRSATSIWLVVSLSFISDVYIIRGVMYCGALHEHYEGVVIYSKDIYMATDIL